MHLTRRVMGPKIMSDFHDTLRSKFPVRRAGDAQPFGGVYAKVRKWSNKAKTSYSLDLYSSENTDFDLEH